MDNGEIDGTIFDVSSSIVNSFERCDVETSWRRIEFNFCVTSVKIHDRHVSVAEFRVVSFDGTSWTIGVSLNETDFRFDGSRVVDLFDEIGRGTFKSAGKLDMMKRKNAFFFAFQQKEKEKMMNDFWWN